MKISELSVDQLRLAVNKVEAALTAKQTKAAIVKALSDLGYCSPKSTGIEATFVKVVEAASIKLTPLLANVMGRPVTGSSAIVDSAKGAPAIPPTTPTTNAPAVPIVDMAINLKGVSIIEASKNGAASIVFIDGSKLSTRTFDAQKFRSNCNQIEFRA